MDPKIQKQLMAEEVSERHLELLRHCKALLQQSRSDMSQYYDTWDANDDAYRATRNKDPEDVKAEQKGGPVKMVVPLTYAQVETFRTFCLGQYFQRDLFYELEATGEEDYVPARLAEAVLDRDLHHNKIFTLAYQLLGDIARFRVGVVHSSWRKETERQLVTETKPGTTVGPFRITKDQENIRWDEVVKFEGTELRIVNPYRFLPDTRLPLTRFQEGEFCAHEEEFSYNRLKVLEGGGEVAGVDHVPSFSQTLWEERGETRHSGSIKTTGLAAGMARNARENILVTQVQVELIPSKFMINEDTPLGEEEYPVKYLIWIANDQRIIRCEPLNYAHNQFTYDIGQFSPDQHALLNESICDVLSKLQDVMNWFINSHITSVRKIIQNRLLIDPNAVVMDDVVNHRPIIRLRPGFSMQGVDKWVKQLDLTDATARHMQDLQTMITLMQMTTSISDNMLGQFSPGRRSAREAGNIAQSSGARLSMHSRLIWEQLFGPLGEKMLANSQMGLEAETAVKVAGELTTVESYNSFVKVDRSKISGQFNFKIFDGSVASERAQRGEVLQNMLLEALKQGEAGFMFIVQVLGYDPNKIMREILTNYGIKHPDRFKLDERRKAELGNLLINQNGNVPGPNGEAPVASNGSPEQLGLAALLAGLNPSGGEPGVPGPAPTR